MKFIEEYIRNLLGREAPFPVDADDLWAGIEAGLPAADDPVAAPLGFSRRGIIGGVILLLILLGGATGWLLWPVTTDNTSENTALVGEPAGDFTPGPSPGERKDEALTSSGTLAITPERARYATGEQYGQSASDLTIARLGAGDNLLLDKSQTEQEPFLAPPTSPAPAAAPQNLRGEHYLNSVADTTGKKATVAPVTPEPSPRFPGTGPGERSKTPPLSSVSIDRVTFSRTLPSATLTPSSFKSTANSRLSLGLHAGGNLQLQRFATSGEGVGNSLNQASGVATGQTIALDLRYRIGQHFAVSLGAEYHRTINTFRHTVERDTLVPHPTPPNTRLIEGIVRHSVAHNNRGVILSVPVLLAYERRFGDFSLGMAAGFSANYELTASGRSLNATGEFIRYSAPVYDQFFLAYHLRPQLAWRPKPGSPWTFELRTDVRYFSRGTSSVIGAAQHGWLSGGTIGIRRDL